MIISLENSRVDNFCAHKFSISERQHFTGVFIFCSDIYVRTNRDLETSTPHCPWHSVSESPSYLEALRTLGLALVRANLAIGMLMMGAC